MTSVPRPIPSPVQQDPLEAPSGLLLPIVEQEIEPGEGIEREHREGEEGGCIEGDAEQKGPGH